MLLIDGVKYEEWTDLRETEDLEPMVIRHAKDIFGENILYIDRKQKLRSLAGTGSIPDAYVISLSGDSPHWHIVEIELSYKNPGRHLITQINDFINGMKNSRNEIVSAINQWIKSDDIRTLDFRQRSRCEDIHEFLSNLIKKEPILTIIIEKKTIELKEAIQIFEERYKTEIIEFRTFRRADAKTVHAYLIESPYISPKVTIVLGQGEAVTSKDTLEFSFSKNNIHYHSIYIPEDKRSIFPADKERFVLDTNIGPIETNIAGTVSSRYLPYIKRNLKQWFDAHPELRRGDKVSISVIEPMQKYRLEIVR